MCKCTSMVQSDAGCTIPAACDAGGASRADMRLSSPGWSTTWTRGHGVTSHRIRARAVFACLALTPFAAGAQSLDPQLVKGFMTAVAQAATITDPYQRCLHMPDLPGSHWRPEAVAAYCRFASEDTLTSTRFRQLIATGHAAEVDEAFASYLKVQLRDPAHSGRLDAAIQRTGIDATSTATRQAIDSWMHQRPDSAFAVAATAIQFHVSAATARGSAAARHTSDEQLRAMRELDLFAAKDFDRASTMAPAVPSMYGHMFAAGVLLGDQAYAERAVARGLALQPTELALRKAHAMMSGEKWGGSAVAVHRQGEEAAQLATHAPLLWLVVGQVAIADATADSRQTPADGNYLGVVTEVASADALASLASLAEYRGVMDQAFLLAVEALRFDGGNARALATVGAFAQFLGERNWADETMIAAAKDHPYSLEVAGTVGGYLAYRGMPEKAEPLLQLVLADRPEDRAATMALAQVYARPGGNKDEALKLLDGLIERNPDDSRARFLRDSLRRGPGDPPARVQPVPLRADGRSP